MLRVQCSQRTESMTGTIALSTMLHWRDMGLVRDSFRWVFSARKYLCVNVLETRKSFLFDRLTMKSDSDSWSQTGIFPNLPIKMLNPNIVNEWATVCVVSKNALGYKDCLSFTHKKEGGQGLKGPAVVDLLFQHLWFNKKYPKLICNC